MLRRALILAAFAVAFTRRGNDAPLNRAFLW
jgi:hypothetical protein